MSIKCLAILTSHSSHASLFSERHPSCTSTCLPPAEQRLAKSGRIEVMCIARRGGMIYGTTQTAPLHSSARWPYTAIELYANQLIKPDRRLCCIVSVATTWMPVVSALLCAPASVLLLPRANACRHFTSACDFIPALRILRHHLTIVPITRLTRLALSMYPSGDCFLVASHGFSLGFFLPWCLEIHHSVFASARFSSSSISPQHLHCRSSQ